MEGSELMINITYEDAGGGERWRYTQRVVLLKWRQRIEWISTGMFMRTAAALRSWRCRKDAPLHTSDRTWPWQHLD